MLPFLNMRHYKEIFQNLRNYLDKMNKNELTVEDVLDEDEIIQDIKTNQNTQFIPFFSNEVIRKLIDYSTKMPIIDDQKKGHKFPFNATEILCCDNNDILERFFNEIKISEDDDSDDEENEEDEEKKDDEKKEEEKKKEEENKEEEKKEKEEKKEEKKKEEEKKEKEEKKEEEKKEEEKKEEEKKEEEKKDENPLSMINLIQDKIEEIEKEKKEKKYKIIYDNIDYFFSFLTTPSTDDNYVLIGYFTKIFNHLIQAKGQIIMSYMFNYHPEYLTGLINHLNRRGIGECVKNILLFNQDIQDLDSLKISFCQKIINELNNTNNDDKFNWITDTLINSISNKDFFNLFMSNIDLLKLIFSILYKNLNNNNNCRALLNLLIKINENILSNFDNLVTANLIQENPMDIFSNMYSYNNYMEEDKNFNEKNFDNLKNNISNLFNSIKESNFNFLEDLNQFDEGEMLTTFQTTQKKLGLKKLSQIEYFRTFIDIIINSNSNIFFQNEIEELIKIANDKKIFWNINDIFFNYEFNNIFQIYYLQIINSILNKFSPELLVKYFFNNNERKLIQLLIDHLINNNKFDFGFSRKTNNCYLPFEIKILNEINESENEYIKQLIKDDSDFKVINEVLVNQINCLFTQKLLEPNEFNIDEEDNKKTVYSLVLDETIDEDIKIFKVYKEGGDYKKLENEKNERINQRKKSDNKLEISIENNDDINEVQEEVINDDLDKNIEKELINVNDIKVEEILGNINLDNELKIKKEDNLKENTNYYDSNYWIHTSASDEEMESIIKDL